MNKKLRILLIIAIVALLAFSLAACSDQTDYNLASTISLKIIRTEAAKDAPIEITTSYGTVTYGENDTAIVLTHKQKDFIVTVSSIGFKTTTLTVKRSDLKDAKGNFTINFGEYIAKTTTIKLQDSYDNFKIESLDKNITYSLKDNEVTITTLDKFKNSPMSIRADGFETMKINFNDLLNLKSIRLVESGYTLLIYKNYYDNIPTVRDEENAIYFPTISSDEYCFSLPQNKLYFDNKTKNQIYLNTESAYGNVINFGSNYDYTTIEISKRQYLDFTQISGIRLYGVSQNGELLYARIDYQQPQDSNKYYITCSEKNIQNFVIYTNSDNTYYAFNADDIPNIKFDKITMLPIKVNYSFYNNLTNEYIQKLTFEYSEYIDNTVKNTTVEIENGILDLTDNPKINHGYAYYNFNGDEFSNYMNFYASYTKFSNNIFYENIQLTPSITTNFEVVDNGRILTGETLVNMQYSNGYYSPEYLYISNAKVQVHTAYSKSLKFSSFNFDFKDFTRIGEKTYLYNRKLHINNNYFYNIDFRLNGEIISNSQDMSLHLRSSDAIVLSQGDYLIESTKESCTIMVTYNKKTYRYTLTPDKYASDGSLFIIDFADYNKQ